MKASDVDQEVQRQAVERPPKVNKAVTDLRYLLLHPIYFWIYFLRLARYVPNVAKRSI